MLFDHKTVYFLERKIIFSMVSVPVSKMVKDVLSKECLLLVQCYIPGLMHLDSVMYIVTLCMLVFLLVRKCYVYWVWHKELTFELVNIKINVWYIVTGRKYTLFLLLDA